MFLIVIGLWYGNSVSEASSLNARDAPAIEPIASLYVSRHWPLVCRTFNGNNTFYHLFSLSRKWLVFSLTFDFAPVLASLTILPKLPQRFVNKMTITFVNSMIDLNEFPLTSFWFYIQIQYSSYMCNSSAVQIIWHFATNCGH